MKRWKTYQKSELIPDTSPEPQVSQSVIVQHLSHLWQLRTNRLLEKLPPEQQPRHLEQCLALEIPSGTPHPNPWRTIWMVLNRPIFEPFAWSSQEPKVQQVSDQGGQIWWYVYDPQTRQSVYLETENEVLIWLEEHLLR